MKLMNQFLILQFLIFFLLIENMQCSSTFLSFILVTQAKTRGRPSTPVRKTKDNGRSSQKKKAHNATSPNGSSKKIKNVFQKSKVNTDKKTKPKHDKKIKPKQTNLKNPECLLSDLPKDIVREWIIQQANIAKDAGLKKLEETKSSVAKSLASIVNQIKELNAVKKELEKRIEEITKRLNDLRQAPQTQPVKNEIVELQECLQGLLKQNDFKKNMLKSLMLSLAKASGKALGPDIENSINSFIEQNFDPNGFVKIASGLMFNFPGIINQIDESDCYDGRLNEKSIYYAADGLWSFGQEQQNMQSVLHVRFDLSMTNTDEVQIQYLQLILDPKYSGPYTPIQIQIDQVKAGAFKFGTFTFKKIARTWRKRNLG